MEQKVGRILLFTVKACPIGRSMGKVLSEIGLRFPDIKIDTFYVEEDIHETNQYRIKQHPTVLFLDHQGKELYRAEGFAETDEITRIIEKINLNEINQVPDYDENQATIEKYKIYLFKAGTPVPIEIEYKNATGVKAPRITAVRLLLETRLDHYENPFPAETVFELIQFEGDCAIITLRVNKEIQPVDMKKMELALLKTLSAFGIKEVKLITNLN